MFLNFYFYLFEILVHLEAPNMVAVKGGIVMITGNFIIICYFDQKKIQCTN